MLDFLIPGANMYCISTISIEQNRISRKRPSILLDGYLDIRLDSLMAEEEGDLFLVDLWTKVGGRIVRWIYYITRICNLRARRINFSIFGIETFSFYSYIYLVSTRRFKRFLVIFSRKRFSFENPQFFAIKISYEVLE